MSEPDYYAKNGLSPLKAFEKGLLSKEEYVGFCKGNVIKYTIRAGEKTDDPLMDIVKAMDYLHYLHKALKTEPKESDTDDEYTVEDLDSKLNEVKDKITDFKKEYGVIHNTDETISVLTEPDAKKREFPKVDTEVRPTEPVVHKPKIRPGNFLSKIRENTIGAWY